MVRDYRNRFDLTEDEVTLLVEGDKEDIINSEVVIANCWKVSVGTSMEILYAYESDIPVVGMVPDLDKASPWISYHCFDLFEDLEAAFQSACLILSDPTIYPRSEE